MKHLQEEYKVGNKTFLYDKKFLKSTYKSCVKYTDDEFIENIIDVLHFAVYVCWIKEISSNDCLADDGIVHELVHLAQKNTRNHSNLSKIREKFNKSLCI
tara:strand:- start:1117 stop:1416 length:300 start_codon:yes stop_codon:yes gene_type:complete